MIKDTMDSSIGTTHVMQLDYSSVLTPELMERVTTYLTDEET